MQPDATIGTTEPAPAQRPVGRLWWLIVGSVTIAAIVVAGVVLALQPSAPSSVDELRSLLITPPGSTAEVSGGRAGDIRAAGPGVRWTVGRSWVDTGHLNVGVVTLTQYETPDQAQDALARLTDQAKGTHQKMADHPGAFYVPGRTVKILGRSVQQGSGAGVTNTVVVYIAGTSDAPDGLQRLLAEQLDRLP